MYTIVPNPDVESTFRKMGKKDAARFQQLIKKPGEQQPDARPGIKIFINSSSPTVT